MTAVRTCTKCGDPAEDYEWEVGEYWCEQHVLLDTVGRDCMGCGRTAENVEDVRNGWYVDNGGQLCSACNVPVSTEELAARFEARRH